MPGHFTLVLLQCESWWVGWVSEVPTVNAHADTRDGLLDTLRTALGDALEVSHRGTEMNSSVCASAARSHASD